MFGVVDVLDSSPYIKDFLPFSFYVFFGFVLVFTLLSGLWFKSSGAGCHITDF